MGKYSMNKLELNNKASSILWWDKEKLKNASVMVVGTGALGNEVLKNLALLGIGKIFLVDFDSIENSNLTRSVLFRKEDIGKSKVETAAQRVKEMNPRVKVRPFHGNVLHEPGLGVYRRMDVVIGCLDNVEARLKVNQCCWKTNIPWVDGGLLELAGTVKVFTPPHSSCFECGMSKLDYQLINVRYSCDLIAYDGQVEGAEPTTSTIASIIGAIQTQEAVKFLHGMEVLQGKGMTYNGIGNECYISRYPRKEDCLSHEHYDNIIELDEEAGEITAREMIEIAETYLGKGTTIQLGYEIIHRIVCPACGKTREITKPVHRTSIRQLKCIACNEECIPEMTHKITGNENYAQKTLFELGISPLDIVTAKNKRRYAYFELTKDVHKIMTYK